MKSRFFFVCLGFFLCFVINFCPTALVSIVPIQSFILTDNTIISYVVQEPVTINGNQDLLSQNWTGNGTFLSPYMIQNLAIEVSTTGAICIEVKHTNLYFSIQDCDLYGGETTIGISFTNVTNGFVYQNTIYTGGTGININSTTDILINNNTIHDTQGALVLNFASSLIIQDNLLANNSFAISSNNSKNNLILSNTITNSPTGGYGIKFYHSNNTLISYNSIFYHNFGFYSEFSSNNNLTYNIFFKNFLKAIFISEYGIGNNRILFNDFYAPVKSIATGSLSQATDNGQGNNFSHNYWSEWYDPDDDEDGIIDLPYLLGGFARNYDYFPLSAPNIHTFVPPTSSFNSSWSFLTNLCMILVIVLVRRR